MASSPSRQPELEKALCTPPPPLPPPSDKKRRNSQNKVQVQSDHDSGSASIEEEEEDRTFVTMVIRSVIGWMTPYEQMTFLRRKRDFKRWELFRDSLMRRWSNLNVICGLIMGAVSTIVFSDITMSKASFTLEIMSLLSSLIAIGFGVGLIYVLGDVRGSSLVSVDDRHPKLHVFALSIPEIWAFISFGTFFVGVSVIVWETANKGWVVKAGVTIAAIALIGHLVAFGFLFREQDTTQYLIPDEPIFATDEPKAILQTPSSVHSLGQSQSEQTKMDGLAITSAKGEVASFDRVPTSGARPGLPSHSMRSSQTLVEHCGSPSQSSTSFRALPARASTAPVTFTAEPGASVETKSSLRGFTARPAPEIVAVSHKEESV